MKRLDIFKCSSFIPLMNLCFSTSYPSTSVHLILPGVSLKLSNDTSQILVFAPTSTFSLLWNYVLLYVEPVQWISLCRVVGPEALSKMKATTLVSYVCCVVLHCHAEGSRLTINDLVFSCE